MIVIERIIQKIHPEKWSALEEIEKKYTEVETGLGFPPKKRFRCLMGQHDSNTLIIERQWESLAAMEAAYEKAFVNPEHQALTQESAAIIQSGQYEVLMPLP
jgi:hypothetical protein